MYCASNGSSNGSPMDCGRNDPLRIKDSPNVDVIRISVVGDKSVGKTSFIREVTRHKKLVGIFENNGFLVHLFSVHSRLQLAFFEVPSDADFPIEQKQFQYRNSVIVIFMYAIDNPDSLERLRTHWIPEVRDAVLPVNHSTLNALIGTKVDLREKGDLDAMVRLLPQNQHFVQTRELIAFEFPDNFPISKRRPLHPENQEWPENKWEITANIACSPLSAWIEIMQTCLMFLNE